MKFKSENMTQASGSIAGVTYAHTKGGVLYRRSRAIPTNPATTYQTQVRNTMAGIVNAWINILTAAQRNAWDLYAANVLVTNPLGDAVPISGQNWYIACNVPRVQADSKLSTTLARVDDAPTVFNRGTFSAITATIGEAAGLSISFNTGDAWVSEDGASMLIFEGRPLSAGRTFFKGPYRLVATIDGDSGAPPTSPHVVTAAVLTANGFTVTEGQKVALAAAVVRADGRLSTRQLLAPALASA